MAHQPEIRGEAEANEQMLLGQVRKVFDPDWLQAFQSGRITVQFTGEPNSEQELIKFMEMYGYELEDIENGIWYNYYFK